MMKADKAYRQVASNRSGLVLEPQGEGERPFSVDTRNTWADFFPMFDLKFLHGNGWDDTADKNLERVVVLSKEMNEKVFGGEDSVGRSVRMNGMNFPLARQRMSIFHSILLWSTNLKDMGVRIAGRVRKVKGSKHF